MDSESWSIDYDEFHRDDYEPEWEEPPPELPRDVKIDEAKETLGQSFEEHDREVFYIQQSKVLFEKHFRNLLIARLGKPPAALAEVMNHILLT